MDLTYVTPLDGAFTKPVASRQLGGLLAAKGIELVVDEMSRRSTESGASAV